MLLCNLESVISREKLLSINETSESFCECKQQCLLADNDCREFFSPMVAIIAQIILDDN